MIFNVTQVFHCVTENFQHYRCTSKDDTMQNACDVKANAATYVKRVKSFLFVCLIIKCFTALFGCQSLICSSVELCVININKIIIIYDLVICITD